MSILDKDLVRTLLCKNWKSALATIVLIVQLQTSVLGNDYVFIENASATLDSPTFTLSMFVNDRGQAPTGATGMGLNRLTSRSGDTFETAIDKHFGTDAFAAYSPEAGWSPSVPWSSAPPALNEWQHVAYVADGAQMTIYVNGEAFGPNPFTGNPSGQMFIGSRVNTGPVESFNGLIDDVSMFDGPLSEDDIFGLASGVSPLSISANATDLVGYWNFDNEDALDLSGADNHGMIMGTPEFVSDVSEAIGDGFALNLNAPVPPPPPADISVVSNADWMLSTESSSGGPVGEWDFEEFAVDFPGEQTFTEIPLLTADSGAIGNINNAALALAGENAPVAGLLAGPGIQYFRTTFDLESTEELSGQLTWAVDNGGAVFINGNAIGLETSFDVANWTSPLPSVEFLADGTIGEVVKVDITTEEFEDWFVGENEIIVAVRNPDDEPDPAGGFALRLDLNFGGSDALRCDFNSDSVCDLADIDLLGNEIINGTDGPVFDLNNDSNVDLADQDEWRSIAATENGFADDYLEGDANLDGFVNANDLNIVGINWQRNTGPWSKGDFDASNSVDATDLNVVGINWQQSLPIPAQTVPEPNAFASICVGLLLLGLKRRRTCRR